LRPEEALGLLEEEGIRLQIPGKVSS